ncbi:QueT transporter family protein [Heyndrickxia ginsengihumi]|uniref:Membrane protein n=1 Tax=Heyndrickxia ginsengihumi TaxID=363870 RepID=A0A0A6V8V5_9BACI|nr:QueT transporter family protein [Heyndrickxia ginsengihumi]KHD84505.1 membrane protein [Heyndrickxia ginsengihumi]MBE6183495.1 QueT transporter family protein [Bacillus sp. (in: firmicutes)]MCM3022934.1 QueT transporter family protein [Heyndrickxia ginsengihumi]NEY20638.1 QueT transporter family protein [Heyndrickxia ginsengihumi]
MRMRTLTINAIVAALYIAVSFIIQPIAYSNIQFRIPEMFNHLIVFNKKYFYGIILGVFLANLFFSPMREFDIIFGVAQSAIALSITIVLSRIIKDIWIRMVANTIAFTVTMFIIALELNLAFHLPLMLTWMSTAIGEFAVMIIGAPIIYIINKRIKFETFV